MEAILKKTTKADQKIAQESIAQLVEVFQKIKNGGKGSIKIKIQENGEFLTIPKNALSLLFEILINMAEGKSINLIPSGTEISTQQAADILNVSRPHVVKLLESGKIPFKKIGSHRRIGFHDLMEYYKKLKNNRNEKLELLAKQAQELNLGY